jgi:Na+/proline symporter
MALLSPFDWAVFAVYLTAIVSWGVFVGRRSRRLTDFFLAGREQPWWAVGLSVMATQISAITFVGTTGQAFTTGMSFLVLYFGLPFAMVVLCVTLVPFFYRAGVVTAYEYLERRFDGRVRTFTSLLFLLSRGLSVGITLYAPSLVLSVILGWSETATILVMAGATIAYVSWGGNRSVIWTDVVQMLFIWTGIFVCVGVAVAQLPPAFSLRDALAVGQAAGRLEAVDLSLDPRKPYTLWSGLLGGFFLAMAYFGTDQSQVQRYLSGRTLRESRLSLLFNAFLKVPMQFLILLTGVLVFVFFHFHPAPMLWNPVERERLSAQAPVAKREAVEQRFALAQAARRAATEELAVSRHRGQPALQLAAEERYLAANRQLDAAREAGRRLYLETTGTERFNDTNYVFPSYVVTYLPRGLAGLVIAVIFAAAMSALSGELNSLATASVVDFYRRFVRLDASEHHYLLASRLLTGFWGLFACAVAVQAGRLGSAIEVVNRFGSYFYGSILGVFLLAVFVPWAEARGALAGLTAGLMVVAATALWTPVAFLWFNAIGAVTVVIVGSLVSWPRRNPPPEVARA